MVDFQMLDFKTENAIVVMEQKKDHTLIIVILVAILIIILFVFVQIYNNKSISKPLQN